MWIIAVVVVFAILAVIGLYRFGPMRNSDRLSRTDPEAAARAAQQLAQHQQYQQFRNIGGGAGL
ncbi:MAG TPA: hypothetical protein VFU36_09625 [Jatrophihabitans sp.]|nr:hypothetical protein [Jatrophihabitans sp.]